MYLLIHHVLLPRLEQHLVFDGALLRVRFLDINLGSFPTRQHVEIDPRLVAFLEDLVELVCYCEHL